MANKRIELEQYKHYISLWEEEPNRKGVRIGMTVMIVAALLLVVFLVISGWLSNSLALNPANVLEKPPGKAPPGQNQQVPNMPGGQQIPNMPDGQQIPNMPGGQPQGMAPRPRGTGQCDIAMWDTLRPPLAASSDGALLAQQVPVVTQPGETGSTAPDAPTFLSAPSSGPSPGPEAKPVKEKKKKKPGPGKQSKGIGNLGNLAKNVSARGFELYVLVLGIALAVVLYLALRKARKEGKAT